ncbi:MAG: hypothetical protein ACJ79S_15435 [Gemmatimonadaceae bacterium]
MIPATLRRAAGRVATATLLAAAVVGCNRLLDATAPDKIDASSFNDPAYANTLVQGAVARFDCAFNAHVVISGLNSGELVESSQTSARYSYDRRTVGPGETLYAANQCDVQQSIGIYTPLQQARFMADDAQKRLEAWTDQEVSGNRQQLIARAAIYAGYARILLGEMFCTTAIDEGPELTSAQVFALAEEKFTTALTAAAAAKDAKLTAFAYAGRARARLDLGKMAEAAADAANVPKGFVVGTTQDGASDRKINRLYDQFSSGFASVSPTYVNLTVPTKDPATSTDTTADTRVALAFPLDSKGKPVIGNDRTTRMITAKKYPTGGTSIPIASYEEAQLIIAEAQGGANAVSIINALRVAAGLPGAFVSSDPVAIQNEVISERSRQLFLQGTRMYDARRLGLPQIPAAGAAYDNGGTYGSQRCLPLPDLERNSNPSLKGKPPIAGANG